MLALRYVNRTATLGPIKPQSCIKQQSRSKSSLYRRGVQFFFKKNLLLTNSLTSGVFMFLGDLVQQEFEVQSEILKKRYDWARSGRMFIVGTIMGPLHHYYYLHIDKVMPKSDMKTVFKKVLCDQLIASPSTIACFFYCMGYLENKTLAESTAELKRKFLYVYAGDCLYWPPVQILNFYYLPTEFRVLYINLATMVFNVFLSFMKHYDQEEP